MWPSVVEGAGALRWRWDGFGRHRPRSFGLELPTQHDFVAGLAMGDCSQSAAGVSTGVPLKWWIGQCCGPRQVDQPDPEGSEGFRLLFEELPEATPTTAVLPRSSRFTLKAHGTAPAPGPVGNKARRKWPWVVGGIVGLLLVIGPPRHRTRSWPAPCPAGGGRWMDRLAEAVSLARRLSAIPSHMDRPGLSKPNT